MNYRACLLVAQLLLVPALALAQSSPDSVVVSSEEVQTLQGTLEEVSKSAESIITRLDQAGTGSTSQGERFGIGSVLLLFLAVAVVFEAAMSAIFDWRVFIRYFEGRGVKTPILVVTALFVTYQYDLDVLNQILEALDQNGSQETVGKFITALLISGGSSAVYRVYSNLGIRSPAERKRKARKEREEMDKAEEQGPENSSDER